MREVVLDFQSSPPGLLSIAILVAGLVLGGDAWWEDSALRHQLEDVESRLAQVKRITERRDDRQREIRPENVFSAEESKALQQAIRAIRVDWAGLYRSIDQAMSEDISLLAVRPSVAGKAVQISGEARDMAAALAFVEALRREPLAHATLLSHQIKQSDPLHPIIFEIGATWLTGS